MANVPFHLVKTALARRPLWPPMRHAIQTATAALLAYAGATYFALPQGYWAVMTAILVVQSNVGASLGLAMDRLGATLLGAAVGGAIVAAFGTEHALTPALLAGAVLLLAYVATARASLRLAPVTAAVVILADPHYGGALHSAVNRVLEIGLGAAIAVVVSLLLFPARAHSALATHVGRTLPLLAEHLAGTIEAALGTSRDPSAFQRFNSRIRAMLITGDGLVAEARRERAGYLAGGNGVDAGTIQRTLRRLWYTSVNASRAAAEPLPTEVRDVLQTPLRTLASAVRICVEGLAAAYAAQGALPDRAPVDAALAALDTAMGEIRRTGLARSLATDDVARLFALTFALDQVGSNLTDLADRCAELRGDAVQEPPRALQI